MKQQLDRFLAQYPDLYGQVLRATRRGGLEKRAYLALVRQGDIVFDVGANEGYFTQLFSHIVGSSGAVHAFEPLPTTFERLTQRIGRTARGGNTKLVNAACSHATGQATLTVPGGDGAQASLATHQVGSWSEPTRAQFVVETLRLDEYADAVQCPRLDFLKIDAEGAELRILHGFEHHLRRLQPVVCIEVCPAWTRDFGYGAAELVDWFASAGYDRLIALHQPAQTATREQIVRLAESFGSINIVAGVNRLHGSRLARLLRMVS